MSRDFNNLRKGYYDRERERDRDWNRNDYRSRHSTSTSRKRSRSPPSRDIRDRDKRRSRSPRKSDKDLLDENILSEISKLPEPSELWDNQTGGFQEPGGAFPPPPPGTAFTQDPPQNTAYSSNYTSSYSAIYEDFPSITPMPSTAPLPPDVSTWNQMALPPPPAPPPFTNVEDQIKKEAAIESEMRHQKAALSKQREDYMKKAGILKKELDTLKDQRNELRGDSKRSPSPDTKRFLKENTKLQLEIQNKLKTINNVVDMLNGIIGEEAQELVESDDSERASKRKSRSPSSGKKFNYVYYDPEMHWCRVCNEFPSTAKDYLNHLHSPAHHKMASAHMEAPWHSVTGINDGFPSFPSAPTKRTPIRGLQFFVPSTAWYCKLCDQFIGDLHCASAHLKSIVHSKNYTNFVEQNPHWETDWMSDRQKAFEKSRSKQQTLATTKILEKPAQYTAHTITFNKDGFHTKRKDSPTSDKKKKDRKKKNKRKKSSSSSSSCSSSSDSDQQKKKRKSKKDKKSESEDKTLKEWMTSIHMEGLTENDRKLLDTLKSRMKTENRDQEKRFTAADQQRKNSASGSASGRSAASRRSPTMVRRRGERGERRTTPTASATDRKPDAKKMPFIGKMPVYKNLTKQAKTEEQKKDDLKKKEEEEANKKRREEMDAEIQKKVAEFKEKIAKAQLERQQLDLPPPALVLPTTLAAATPPPMYAPPAPEPPTLPPPTAPPPPLIPPPPQASAPAVPNLSKDFQDALDIIFPSEAKKAEMAQQELLAGFGFGLPGVMQPIPPLMHPGLLNPQMMMGFDMNPQLNPQLFPPRPQLYDAHVPIVPKPRQNKNMNNKRHNNNQKQNEDKNKKDSQQQKQKERENGEVAKKKETMDDLAMLGIDASDVGAGI